MLRKLFALGAASLLLGLAECALGAESSSDSFDVHLTVDAARPMEPLKPVWRFFGADEPNYAYLPNGSKLLHELGALSPGQVYFRTHNLLTSGDGTPALKWGSTGVYSEDPDGKARYDWTILDRIFDAYASARVAPYIEMGFMPEALSIKPEPYRHHWNPALGYNEIYTGWTYPPKDYARWSELIYQWARHCVERYGQLAVDTWFWQTWNEPNIGYWRGSREEFLKLHDYAVQGVRRALPSARVGGADTAGSGGNFTRSFIEHCLRGTNYATGTVGTPLDFVSFHAKGAPVYTNGYVRMGMAAQLRTVRDGFRIISSFPELRGKPVVIGECDPEGCAACQGPQLAYRNGTMYSSYTAASFGAIQALARGEKINLEGALTWAFEFEDQPYFAGFRSLASGGIDKPVLNVFRMWSRMAGQELPVECDGALPLDEIMRDGVTGRAHVSGMASMSERAVHLLLWHYHDDDVPGPIARIKVAVRGLPARADHIQVRHFRIDNEHSNAFAAWKKLGSPQHLSPEQKGQLERAGQLETIAPSDALAPQNGSVTMEVPVPRQAVSLLEFSW